MEGEASGKRICLLYLMLCPICCYPFLPSLPPSRFRGIAVEEVSDYFINEQIDLLIDYVITQPLMRVRAGHVY